MKKRYCLMKLVSYNEETGLETWKYLNMSANSLHILNNFMANGHRIYDTKENRVVITKLDLEKWMKEFADT